MMDLTIQHIEQWRSRPDILASGRSRDDKHKQFEITPNGWAYVYVNRTLVATFTEMQSAIEHYNAL